MKLSKRFYYILAGLVALPVVLFGIAVLIVYTNSDVIKDRLLAEINKSTGANASIKGKVELSFFKHFPNVALEMKGVEVKGSVDSLPYPLMKADRVYFLAGLWDVVNGDWKIKSTSIENGEVSMLRSKTGVVNYGFKTAEKDTSKASFSIDVNRALLRNMRYRLMDEMAEVEIDVQVDKASVNGNFTAQNLSLKTAAEVFSHSVKIKGIDYANEKHISFDGALAVMMTEKESYILNVERFDLEKNEFAIHGNITMENNNPVFDLAIRGKNVAVEDIPSLLPAEYASTLEGIKGTGNLQVSAEIKGALDTKRNPAITMNGSFSQATLQIPGMDGKISELTFKGTFTNGSKQRLSTSVVTVQGLSAKIKQGAINGSFVLSNLDNPQLNLDIDGAVDLSIVNKFLDEGDRLKEIGGILNLKNVTYAGTIANLQAMRLIGMEGSVTMSGVEMRVDQQKIMVPDAKLSAYDKALTIDKLDVKFPESSVSLSGKIDQMPGLTAGSRSNVPKADLVLRSESINVKEILALMNGTESGGNSNGGGMEQFGFAGNIKVQAGHIVYNKFNAYDASGLVALNGNEIELKDFSCNTVDGMLDLNSTITMQGGKFITKTHAQGSGINLNEMFAQLDNFNQTTVTDKHISGKLTFTADVNADFVNGKLDEKKLSAVVDLIVKQGELINLKSLESLSRFIDIDDLRHIKFSTLKNKITISNQTIHMPDMLVESNAINIAISGSQTFSGALNYSVKLNMLDVLAKKIRKRKDLTEYEEAGEDNFNFYLSLTGTTDNPVVKYAKRGMKERLADQAGQFRQTGSSQETTGEQPKNLRERITFTNKRKPEEEQPESPEEETEYIEWEEEP